MVRRKLTAAEIPACVDVSYLICLGSRLTYHAEEGRKLGGILAFGHGGDVLAMFWLAVVPWRV